METIKDLLKSADGDNQKLALAMIRAIVKEAKLNADDKVIRELAIITKPYKKVRNKKQKQSFHIIYEAAKHININIF
jgi:hypothetical protein